MKDKRCPICGCDKLYKGSLCEPCHQDLLLGDEIREAQEMRMEQNTFYMEDE
jgi:hypothetical protein